MSGPKHLWSGDWEDESARAAARRGYEVLEPEPEPVVVLVILVVVDLVEIAAGKMVGRPGRVVGVGSAKGAATTSGGVTGA